jgi:acyl-CoA synthetase (NDP forming)
MKITGSNLAHKSDRGGVALNIRSLPEAELAARNLGALAPELLIERMVEGGVAEILAGVVSDPQFGQVLVLGGGGVQAELWQDSVRLLPPWTANPSERHCPDSSAGPCCAAFAARRRQMSTL